jgi:hypothetical protein
MRGSEDPRMQPYRWIGRSIRLCRRCLSYCPTCRLIPCVAAETDCEPSDRPCSRRRKNGFDKVSSLTTWEMASRTETGLPQERPTRTIGLTSYHIFSQMRSGRSVRQRGVFGGPAYASPGKARFVSHKRSRFRAEQGRNGHRRTGNKMTGQDGHQGERLGCRTSSRLHNRFDPQSQSVRGCAWPNGLARGSVAEDRSGQGH